MRIIAELMRGCLKQVVGGSSDGRVMEYVLGKKRCSSGLYIGVLGFNSKFDNLN